MIYRFIVLNGPLQGQRLTVERAPTIIGRAPDCPIHIPDEEVARRHAILEHRGDGLFIRDLGSMNRILVNNREVREAKLKHGDEIELGRTRLLVQALVQAEVRWFARRSKARFALVAGGVAVAVVAGVTVSHWRGRAARSGTRETGHAAALVPAAAIPESAGSFGVAVTPTAEGTLASNHSIAVEGGAAVEAEAAGTFGEGSGELVSEQLRRVLEDLVSRKIIESQASAGLGNGRMPAGTNEAAVAPPVAITERLRLRSEEGPADRAALRRIRISSLVQYKFQENEAVAEMRAVDVGLTPETGVRDLRADAVKIEVSFFDENPGSGEILRTRAIVSQAPLEISGPWGEGTPKTLTATYVVPRNLRPNDANSDHRQYYGFVVRVFYDGELQEAEARPRSLLRRLPAAEPGGSAGDRGDGASVAARAGPAAS